MDLLDIPMENVEFGRIRETAQQKICIVGAGAAGLAALKTILGTRQYSDGLWLPTVFEARDNVGGVWLPAPPVDNPPLTPLYDSLTTNLPHPVMAFSSYSFPPSTPVFPVGATVQRYLDSYAEHFKLRPHISLNVSVVAVARKDNNWEVKLSTGETRFFDLVIICNGHYRKPRYPETKGIKSWIASGKATHSAWYRRPSNYGDTVLVVGAGPSGQDISNEMRGSTPTVIHSVTGALREDINNLKRRGRVLEFAEDGSVTFEDGSSEAGIDHCILATGYEMAFPFFSDDTLRSGTPPPIPPFPSDVYNSTYSIFPLAKHIFPLQSSYPPTTLCFLGLPSKVAPFPLVEAQAEAAVSAFAFPERLDLTREAVDILTHYERLEDQVGDAPSSIAKAWSKFEGQEQFDYRDELCEFAADGNMAPRRVQDWEKEMYEKKDVLRKVWVDLERKGEVGSWVKGVGENGPHEWIDLLKRLLTKAEEAKVEIGEYDKSKL